MFLPQLPSGEFILNSKDGIVVGELNLEVEKGMACLRAAVVTVVWVPSLHRRGGKELGP